MININKRLDLVLSAAIYVAGTASLFLVDIFLAKQLDAHPALLADWAFFRSLVFFGGGVALFGCEQAVVRAPMNAKRLLPPVVVQIIALSLPFGLLPVFFPMAFSPLSVIVGAASLAIIMAVCGHFRSHLFISLSQICANGWKVVFGLMVVLGFIYQIPYEYLGDTLSSCLLLFAGSCVAIGLWLDRRVCEDLPPGANETRYRDLLPIGSRFWIFAIMANCVTYLDQILLSVDGQKLDASLFFSYRAIFLPIVLLSIGYIGVVVAPYIRKKPDAFRRNVRRWLLGFGVLGIIVISLALIAGIAIGSVLGKFDLGLNWPLILAFLVMGSLRYLYILPSAMMSVYATKKELDGMLAASAIGVLAMVLIYFLLQQSGVRPIWSVSIGSITNLICRIGYGLWLSITIFRSGRPIGSLT